MSDGWTLHTLLDDMAGRGDAPALAAVHGDDLRTVSYAEVVDTVRRLAGGLVRAGVEPGEPVAVYAPNSIEWALARLAVGAAGALATPFEDQSGEEELAGLMRESGARRVFTVARHVPALRRLPIGPELEMYLLDEPDGDADGARRWDSLLGDAETPLPDLDPEAAAVLLLTSGTTGAPKSFTLSHRNIATNVHALTHERIIGPGDRVLLPLPLHHVYPYVVGLLTPFSSGSTVVLPESVTGPQLLQALRVARVTVMVGVPRLYIAILDGLETRIRSGGRAARALFRTLLGPSKWLDRRFGVRIGKTVFASLHKRLGPDLRLLVSGGAKLEAKYSDTLRGLGWEVRSGYGLAETASIFTANLPRGRSRRGSEGVPLDDGKIRIGDPNEDGVGEIRMRGPSVFDGYRKPEHNENLFTEDGWLRTGDLGYLDDDGFTYVIGRTKEMIVLGGGKNVFPEDLEKVYGDSPYVREIALLECEGALVALVVPDPEAIRQGGAGTNVHDALRVWFNEAGRRLAPYERLAGFAVTREPLPRTRLGKIRRFLLPELYDEAKRGVTREKPKELTDEDRALLARHPAGEVFESLKQRYPDKPVSLDASPGLDLGIDSLEWMTLSIDLQDRYGVQLDEEVVAGVETVRDLLQAIADAAERGPAEITPGALRPEQTRWLEPPGAAATAVGMGLYWLVKGIMRGPFRLTVSGREHLPEPPYVITPNHVSDLDPLAVAAALPLGRLRHSYWGGTINRLFGNPVSRGFARAARIFPVDDRSPAATLAMAVAVLERGNGLTWFPESWRSPDGRLQRFLPGIGQVLMEADVPAVPAHIDGTFEAMPRDRRWPRPHKVHVTFGPPVTVEELKAAGEGDTDAARIANALRDRVAALAPDRGAG